MKRKSNLKPENEFVRYDQLPPKGGGGTPGTGRPGAKALLRTRVLSVLRAHEYAVTQSGYVVGAFPLAKKEKN